MINSLIGKVKRVLQGCGAVAASEEDVKLLGAVGSPFVLRVQVALALKGIDYRFIPENIANKSDLLLKYNPVYKKIPVFVHNEKPVSESLVILEYIEETWKQNPIFPSDPYQRAMARLWSKFIDDKCVAAALKSVFLVDEEKRKMASEELLNALQFLENELKNTFFGGEEIGIVDMAALFIPLMQEVADFQLFTSENLPKLHKWSKDFYNHPIVRENMPSKEQQLAYYKAVAGILAAMLK